MIRNILIGLLLLISDITLAQDISFVAKVDRFEIALNERLRIDFEMNKDGDNFIPPKFNGFEVVSGPSQSTGYSWINGKSSYKKTYTYFIEPIKEGSFTINQAVVEIEGETYKTLPLKIKVIPAIDNPNDPRNSTRISSKDIQVIAEVSKTNPYLSEAVHIQYKLYFSDKVSIANIGNDIPKLNNFFKEVIPVERYSIKQSILKGKSYRSILCYEVIAFPQKTGKLTIEPLPINLVINIPNGRIDFFGRPEYEQIRKNVASKSKTINVKPLPSNAPEGFSGAVGNFKLSFLTNKNTLKSSESLQAVLKLSGKGNLKLIDLPKILTPSSVEVYAPESSQDISIDTSGMSGSISNSYTLVFQSKGKFVLPKVAFSYFDTNENKYNTLYSKEVVVNVTQGPKNQSRNYSQPNDSNAVVKQVISGTDEQFNFLKLETEFRSIEEVFFFGSTLFYILYFSPFGIFILSILMLVKKRKSDKNKGSVNLKQAKLAKKYLTSAKGKIDEKESFHIALERALNNYLKAKLDIEMADFSKDKIQSILRDKGIDDGAVNDFIDLLSDCEIARYSPLEKYNNKENYDRAVRIISLIDKQV